MKQPPARFRNLREYLASLAAAGRYLFSSREAQAALGNSAVATKLALNRHAKRGVVASPVRGFHLIVPPEYRTLGCLPPAQFIPELMERTGRSYYAGLLTAAQYHGAAHLRPQQFQVVIDGARRPIVCGTVRVVFISRKRAGDVPIQIFNTPRGTLRVSTPEATALDLVGHERHVGGLNRVASILVQLAELIDPDKLVVAAGTAPITWAQRVGYLLDRTVAPGVTAPLRAYVKDQARRWTLLVPGAPHDSAQRSRDWKLHVNAEVEAEP